MEKMIQEFIQFCFDNGGFLRNHKEFSARSQRLLEAAIKIDLDTKESAISRSIVSGTYAPELLIAVAPEVNYNTPPKFDPSKNIPIFVLVYRFERQVSEKEYAYTFAGGRIK